MLLVSMDLSFNSYVAANVPCLSKKFDVILINLCCADFDGKNWHWASVVLFLEVSYSTQIYVVLKKSYHPDYCLNFHSIIRKQNEKPREKWGKVWKILTFPVYSEQSWKLPDNIYSTRFFNVDHSAEWNKWVISVSNKGTNYFYLFLQKYFKIIFYLMIPGWKIEVTTGPNLFKYSLLSWNRRKFRW